MSTENIISSEFEKLNTRLANISDDLRKELSAKFENEYKKLEGQLTDLQGKIVSGKIGNGASVPGLEDYADKFSFQRAYSAIARNNWDNAGFEHEVITAAEKNAVNQGGTDSIGGRLIPVQISNDFIEDLKPALILNQVGATVLSNLPPGVYEFTKKVNRLSSTTMKSETGRSTRIAGPNFSSLRLTPHTASAYVPVTERVLNNSNPSIEAMIRDDLKFALQEQMETQIFFGSGSNNEVLGLARTPGVIGANNTGINAGDKHVLTSDVANGQRLSLDDCLVTLMGILSDANALTPNANINLATNHGVLRLMMTEKSDNYSGQVTNQPYKNLLPLTQAKIEEVLGFGIKYSNIFPISGDNQGVYTGTYDNPASGNKKLCHGFFGNWKEILLAMYGGLSIAVSRDASDIVKGKFTNAFTQHQVWIRASMEFDWGIRHEESMVVLNNLKSR